MDVTAAHGPAAVLEQRPTDEIRRVSQAVYDDFIVAPSARNWMRSSKAICFYGYSQYARNVQMRGLREAAQSWGIPFHYVAVGAETDLGGLLEYEHILFITTMALAPRVIPVLERRDGKIALIANYYETPNVATIPRISAEDAATLDRCRDRIAVALSECSPSGKAQYCRGFVDNHGVPVMSFTWAINLVRHFPVVVPRLADLVFLGSYFEKTARIDEYLGEPLRGFSHTVYGYGWDDSPFPIEDRLLPDFDAVAPALYSGHAVCLNVHHAYEEGGFTCNERVFNTVACGGFQIADYAPRIRDFFAEDEVVVAADPADFMAKVEHFVQHPDERAAYVEKARRRVVADHTYHHRLCDLLWYVLDGKTRYTECPVLEA